MRDAVKRRLTWTSGQVDAPFIYNRDVGSLFKKQASLAPNKYITVPSELLWDNALIKISDHPVNFEHNLSFISLWGDSYGRKEFQSCQTIKNQTGKEVLWNFFRYIRTQLLQPWRGGIFVMYPFHFMVLHFIAEVCRHWPTEVVNWFHFFQLAMKFWMILKLQGSLDIGRAGQGGLHLRL